MKNLFALCICLITASAWAADSDDKTTLTKIGEAAPEFKVTTLDGKAFDLKAAQGKVVLVNFFATWCGPCMQEMPHLQSEIWNQFKDTHFVMVAIDREETEQVVADFEKKRAFPFPIACDPKREVYGKFATQFIPRNILVGADGKIVFQSMGYSPEEFQKLVAAIGAELAKTH